MFVQMLPYVWCITVSLVVHEVSGQALPLVISTWSSCKNATEEAWQQIQQGTDLVDAIVKGCNVCEKTDKECGAGVGYGDKPDEEGETSQDAFLMDGRTMNVGAVGGLRRIKHAISVAQYVLEYTDHSLIVGDQATSFAMMMGFETENLATPESLAEWQTWESGNCQPNFRRNVSPDPFTSCGPYAPPPTSYRDADDTDERKQSKGHDGLGDVLPRREGDDNHDTIGMIIVDIANNVAAGTTTNGLRHKVPGRVGDSPIPGAGGYAENGVGAAVSTGNGDIMMRFSPAFHAVDLMSQGSTPQQAAETAVDRIAQHFSTVGLAIITANTQGQYGVACGGSYTSFTYSVRSPDSAGLLDETIICA